MFDLKVIRSVLDQLEEERGIPRDKVLEAISMALAAAYKKEYGKKGQIIKASFDLDSGKTDFYQVKLVVDPSQIMSEEEAEDMKGKSLPEDESQIKIRFNPEHHILLEDAKKIKKEAKIEDEMVFPLEVKSDYGRIAAQTAKQVIMQKIREAEKVSVLEEFGQKEGEIVSGTVQRVERGTIFIDLGRAIGVIPYEDQIPGERYKQGERIRASLINVEETPKGITLRLSRSNTEFLKRLFEIEVPEIGQGIVEIKGIAREAGSRSKIAIKSNDPHIDPIGSMVGQHGARVRAVMNELGGEKIDVIEWSEDPSKFVRESISPATAIDIKIFNEENRVEVYVKNDQQSLAIGKGGQNVRLAAKLTGWKIDIKPVEGTEENQKPKEDTPTKDLPKEKEEDIKS